MAEFVSFELVMQSIDVPIPSDRLDVESWRASCPVIETLVWKPASHQCDHAAGDARYERRVRDVHKELFGAWPTLRHFERTLLESKKRPCRYIAFTRGEGGKIERLPAIYYADSWRRVH